MIKKIDHIAIAVRNIEDSCRFYKEHLGLEVSDIEELPKEKVKVAFIPIGDVRIELVAPLSEDSPISSFLDKKGEGLHHICLETWDIHASVEKLKQEKVRLLDTAPRSGSHDSQIAFIHPKANSGVLTELSQPAK